MKKIISIMLSFVMILSLSGCANNGNTNHNEQNTGIDTEFRTIVDHTGEEVQVPSKIEKVVITSLLPLPSVFCLYKGSADGLVGIPASSKAAAENSMLVKAYPEIRDIAVSSDASGDINIEQIMNLEPDVVFYHATNEKEKTALKNSGIPAVGFATNLSGYNTIETFADWIELLGKIYGEESKAQEIIDYGRNLEEMVLEKTRDLKDKDRPKVLVLYRYGEGQIAVGGGKIFTQYWIPTCGGINVAEKLDASTPEVNMEQIYEWNPDVVFLTNFTPYMPEDLYNNTIEGYDWSRVNAVINKKVYKYPLGMYRWAPPSSDTPMSLLWQAKTLQSDLFADLDLDKEIKNYFEKYYNMTLTNEDLHAIYNPSREAAGK